MTLNRLSRPVLFAVLAAAPLVALGWTAFGAAAARLDEAFDEANLERAQLTAALVETDLAVRLAVVSGAAADQALLAPAAARDAAAVRRRLAAVRAGSHGVDRAFVTDAAGTLWADDPPAPESHGKAFQDRGWFLALTRSSAPVVSGVYTRFARPQVTVVAMAAPLVSSGRRVGILVHQYRVEHLAERLGARRFGAEGRIVTVDHAGRSLSPLDERDALRFAASPPVRGVLAGKGGTLRYEDGPKKRPMTAAFAPVRAGGSGWGVVALAPAAEGEAALVGLRLRIALATLLAALLAAGAAAWAGRARERELAMARELEARGRHFEVQTQELARSNADLEQFAYLASHDLQAPLRSLKNYCDLFSERAGAALNDDGRRLIDLSRQSVLRMQRMVADLLEFSRLGRDNVPPRPVALDACLDVALADLGPELARRRGTLERTPLPTVQGREAQLTRLFQNLVSNALKYCEAEPRVRVSAELADGVCTVSVTDNGIGIPEEKREAVFGLFERLHAWEKFEGSGIGLAACRKIVEHHRGRIWLEPASPHGTVVKFTLPA